MTVTQFARERIANTVGVREIVLFFMVISRNRLVKKDKVLKTIWKEETLPVNSIFFFS